MYFFLGETYKWFTYQELFPITSCDAVIMPQSFSLVKGFWTNFYKIIKIQSAWSSSSALQYPQVVRRQRASLVQAGQQLFLVHDIHLTMGAGHDEYARAHR